MNPHTKLVLRIISFVGLALSIIPAFLVCTGTLSKETYLQLLLVGMLMWFGSAIFWIRADHPSE